MADGFDDLFQSLFGTAATKPAKPVRLRTSRGTCEQVAELELRYPLDLRRMAEQGHLFVRLTGEGVKLKRLTTEQLQLLEELGCLQHHQLFRLI